MSDVCIAVREEESLMDWGSEFQRVGAATEKALPPQDLRLVRVGRDRRLAAAERRERVGVREEVSQVGWGQVMEGFVCH